MKREEALSLVRQEIKNKNLISHTYAVEAVMRTLAKRLSEDEEKWGLAGLLHDIDYEETKDDPTKHTLIGAEKLTKLGIDNDIVYAVKVHNELHGLPRNSDLDKALYAADPLTGLIVASTLVLPDRKLKSLTANSVLKRFKENRFAAGANREAIAACSEIDLSLQEFVKIGLKAMQSIDKDLGL